MFADRERVAASSAAADALDCLAAAVDAVRPATVVPDRVTRDGDALCVDGTTYDLGAYDEVLVLGGGKGAGDVAAALAAVLGDALDGGVVVSDEPADAAPVEVLVGDHPLPTDRSVAGARAVRDAADAAGDRTLVLAALTGGGSALLTLPAGDVGVDDVAATTRALLDAGAPIADVNAVRKHLSAVKGGRLARAAAPATVVTLLFSDVVGDDPAVVASGPTVPDPTTYADALSALDSHGVDAPAPVRAHLESGAAGDHPETPDRLDADVHVLANNLAALEAAADAAADRGYAPLVLSSRVRGEAREAALTHVAVAAEARASGHPLEPPAALLAGGETTVTVRGDGTGGPNMEFALAAALEIDDGVTLAAMDTDGADGSTDAAGAVVDGDTVADESAARAALAVSDAYSHLDARDALLRTGRTGVNVNDVRVALVTDETG